MPRAGATIQLSMPRPLLLHLSWARAHGKIHAHSNSSSSSSIYRRHSNSISSSGIPIMPALLRTQAVAAVPVVAARPLWGCSGLRMPLFCLRIARSRNPNRHHSSTTTPRWAIQTSSNSTSSCSWLSIKLACYSSRSSSNSSSSNKPRLRLRPSPTTHMFRLRRTAIEHPTLRLQAHPQTLCQPSGVRAPTRAAAQPPAESR